MCTATGCFLPTLSTYKQAREAGERVTDRRAADPFFNWGETGADEVTLATEPIVTRTAGLATAVDGPSL